MYKNSTSSKRSRWSVKRSVEETANLEQRATICESDTDGAMKSTRYSAQYLDGKEEQSDNGDGTKDCEDSTMLVAVWPESTCHKNTEANAATPAP